MGINIKKAGVFFSIDALIALSIVLILLLAIYPVIKTEKKSTKLTYDLVSSLSALKVGDFDNPYARSLIEQKIINNTNNSILEQIGEFYVTNLTLAKEFTEVILGNLTLSQNIGIWYGTRLLASKNITPYETAKNIETTRQIITGLKEGETLTGFSAKAFLTNSLLTKYTYFGGYIGDGNITARIEYQGNISTAEMEISINNNFTIYINGNYIGIYNSSTNETTPSKYILPTAQFSNGANIIEIKGNNNLYVAGGFIKITYESNLEYQQPTRQYLYGIDGLINIYDGLYIPGQLQKLDLFLHYKTNQTLFITIGNVTIFNSTSPVETNTTIPDSTISTLLNYNSISNATVPIRIGLQEAGFNGTGNADVILITDTSGSMDWRLNSDSTGTSRNCSDPLLNTSTTKRISLAKCLDYDFVANILTGSNNRIGLVSFGNNADTKYVNLTTNKTLLNDTITSYSPSGATCVSCAINRAYLLLQSQSNSSRKKFIVTMTDGVTNLRSTSDCRNINGAGSINEEEVYAGGLAGIILKKANNSWNQLISPTSATVYDLDIYNITFGFAAGSSGVILQWNGAIWAAIASPTSTQINSIDILNGTLTKAITSAGSVIQWNGSSWSTQSSVAGTMSAIEIYNGTLIFVGGTTGTRSVIYKSVDSGSSWTTDYTSPTLITNIKSIKIINATKGFAVGSIGEIVEWNGASWSSVSSSTTSNLYTVNAYNATTFFAGGGNVGSIRIMKNSGNSWSASYLNSSGDSIRDLRVFAEKIYAVGQGATIVEYNGTKWKTVFEIPAAYSGNNTAGISCNADEDACSEENSFPAMNANYSSCRIYKELNSTVYSIGFGPIASCNFANFTLKNIAACGNGGFYASNDAIKLKEFYTQIANEILKISFAEQTSQVSGNISTKLYSDSYIEFSHIKPSIPYGILLSLEKQFDNTDTGTFSIPPDTKLVEAKAVSYSGPKWTSLVVINNASIYNLSTYGNSYQELGDPYAIGIPISLINILNNNTVKITTGVAPGNISTGSQSNKIIYTFIKNASSFTPISSTAVGCIWTIQFEDNTNATIKIPKSYIGTTTCLYQENQIVYDQQDSFQTAAFLLLRALDFNNNQKSDIKLSDQNLQIEESAVTGVPYTWSTEVQIRTWN